MINFIKRQPIVFEPKDSDTPACMPSERYCQLARLNDKLCFQARQTSCLPQILCNNTFNTFGSDLLLETGDFDSMDEFQNWYAPDDTWEWNSYAHSMCTFEGHAESDAEFAMGLYAMSDDCTYMLTFTVTGLTDREADPDRILTVILPDLTEQVIDTDGTYSFASANGPKVVFRPGANAVICIDDVTLQCSGSCWDVTNAGFITFSDSGLCKKAGLLDVTLTEQSPSLIAGKYYQLIVEVTGLTDGQVEFFLGTVSLGVIDDNGIFTLSGISDDDTFSFVMDGDFDGCIREIDLYMLSQDYTLKLKNLATDVTLLDLTTSLVYTNDLIEACIEFDEVTLGAIQAAFVNNQVCMYLEIESPADGDVVINGGLTATNNTSILDDWGLSTLENERVNGMVMLKGGTGYFKQDLTDTAFVQGADYYVSFDIRCLDHGDTDPDFDSFTGSLGANTDGTGGAMIWDSTNFPDKVGHYVYHVTAGTDDNTLAFYFDDSAGLNKICLDNISVRTTACPKELYQSNCITYGNMIEGVPAWEGSKLFTACNEEGESMGFVWDTGFRLVSRLFADIINPTMPTKKEETYLFSDGRLKRVYAELSKKFDLVIHEVDEQTHDCIATMLKCDQLWIDSSDTLTNRYVCLDNEYSPEWDKKGELQIVAARTEITPYENSIFNTNCK